MIMEQQSIDWSHVNWLYFGLLVGLVFITSFIGNALSFRRLGLGALISAVLFGGLFVLWTYYPHHLPLPNSPIQTVATSAATPTPAVPSAPAAPPAPVKPANPVRDITPPSQQ
jgi:1,4-dihydroxy-2-naphthoate octaprenyltransferase